MSEFDDDRVAELIAIFGPEDLSMVMDAFLDEAAQVISGLERLISDQPDRVRDQQFDYLARAAENMGAAALAATCRSYERSARFARGDFDAVRSTFDSICRDITGRLENLRSDAA